jgi:hypothetical protein
MPHSPKSNFRVAMYHVPLQSGFWLCHQTRDSLLLVTRSFAAKSWTFWLLFHCNLLLLGDDLTKRGASILGGGTSSIVGRKTCKGAVDSFAP